MTGSRGRNARRFAAAGLVAALGLALPSILPAQARPVAAVSLLSVVRVSGPSPFAHCIPVDLEAQTAQSSYLNSEVEPRLAVQRQSLPGGTTSLIGVWQQDRWRTGGARGLLTAYSQNAGRTWGISQLPFTACSSGGLTSQAASDPWISIGPDGTAYAAGLTLGVNLDGGDRGVAAATSTDGGKTWSHVQLIAADTSAMISDKESVTADPIHPGVAYVVWDRTGRYRGQDDQPGWFSRTVDAGKSWSKPAVIPGTHGRTISHQIAVDPRSGMLYDIFSRESATAQLSCDPEQADCSNAPVVGDIVIIRSKDGGRTWSAPVVVSRYRSAGVGSRIGAEVRTGTRVPEFAIDTRNGTLYVAWEDSRFHGGKMDGIALAASSDGGRHWGGPWRVAAPPNAAAVTPSLAVSANGQVGVTYYTVQKRQGKSPYLPCTFWFTESSPGGRHFVTPVRLAGPFNLLNAPDANGFFVGDYEGLAPMGAGFGSFFTRVNDGSITNRTDIYFASIPDSD